MMRFRELCTKKTLLGLGLGQVLSLLITSTGFTSSELAREGINAPTAQSFLNYVFLAILYGAYMLYKKRALKAKWYYYLILGLVDVEANFLVVKAYQYTSITSVMLLDCWTIPCVMLLTWLFLKTKYRFKKIIGALVCVAGVVLVIFSDVHADERSGKAICDFITGLVVESWSFQHLLLCGSLILNMDCSGSNPLKGNAFVIAGATLYGVSNVSEEYLVKNADRVELMAFLGLFGGFFSAIQISILERNELKSIHWTAGAALPFVGFSVAMFLFYSLVPVLLKMNGSTMFNLSLLTSDMWAVVIRIFAYHEKVDWMYFIAFAAVVVGLIIYSVGDKEEGQNCAHIVDEEATQSKRHDEESCSRIMNQGTGAGSPKAIGEKEEHVK